MIGCGSVAEVKSGPGFYKASNSSLAAVASRRPEAARSYAARHGVAKAYDTVAEMLADSDIDAVYIATPPSSHLALCVLAATAGKHVYVEKPMAMCEGECRAIVAACNENGVRLFVAFYRRALPRFLQVKQWVDSGAIGELRCVRVLQHQPPEPDEMSRATLPWRVIPALSGGGKFLDMSVHMFDIFDFWFGPIEEAYGIASNRGGLYDADDTVTATWRHASGVQGCGSWSYVCGSDEDRIEIVGSRGQIEFSFFGDKPLKLTTERGVQDAEFPNPAHLQQPFIQSIVDDLLGLAPCPGSVDSALRTTWVTDRILARFREESAG
jgi:predicted dehydrogenase